MISKVCAINETVEVAACDYLPKEEDFELSVRFCPNLKYTIVLECSVTNTYSLQWMINNSVVTFYPDDPCNETKGRKKGFLSISSRSQIIPLYRSFECLLIILRVF